VGKVKIDHDSPKKSFARAIASGYRDNVRKDEKEDKIVNFASRKDFLRKNARDLIPEPKHIGKTDYYRFDKSKDDLSGKIVLIGGEFDDAGDTYPTPGHTGLFPQPEMMSGVELNAQAIESDLLDANMAPIRKMPCLLALFLDIAMGTFFVGIFWFVREYLDKCRWCSSHHLDEHRGPLFVIATAFTILFAIGISRLFFKASIWMSFIPILIGANIHQYIEYATEMGKVGKKKPA
jgi:CHASE2 domain-containing sensor protein